MSDMINHGAVLRTVLQTLQADPGRYKLFGVWWWPIKALLKKAGNGPDQLYMLGGYMDPETAAQVPPANLDDTLRAALDEYAHNASFGRSGGRVEAPDGEIVTIWDGDAGL